MHRSFYFVMKKSKTYVVCFLSLLFVALCVGQFLSYTATAQTCSDIQDDPDQVQPSCFENDMPSTLFLPFIMNQFEGVTTASVSSCSKTIPSNQTVITQNDLNHGNVLCLANGTRGILTIRGVRGSSGNPVIIRNKSGVVTINANGKGRGITFDNSQHIRVTGTGVVSQCGYPVTSQKCGIVIYNVSNAGVVWQNGSEEIELDHVEIYNPNTSETAAGIRASDNKIVNNPTTWIQRNTHIHHTYIHDLGSEAMYIGTGKKKDGEFVGLPLRGVNVHHNRIVNTVQDGIQVKDAFEGTVQIHHNYIENTPGIVAPSGAGNAIVFNDRTRGAIYNNILIAANRGIAIDKPDGQVTIYNNLLIDNGTPALNKRPSGLLISSGGSNAKPIRIFNNTIVKSNGDGILAAGGVSEIFDNIILGSTGQNIKIVGANVTKANNVTSGSVNSFGFKNPASNDFRLTSQANKAINKARYSSCSGNNQTCTTFDLDGKARPQGAKADIGAYEFGGSSPPPATNTPTPTSNPPTPTSTSTPGNEPTPTPGNTPVPTNTPVLSSGSVGGRVWRDSNGNGIQEASEAGISGVKMRMRASNGSTLGTTTTDNNGNYLFTGMPVGDHVVHVETNTLPGNLIPTYDRDGTYNNKSPINLRPGTSMLDAHFGYRSP